MVSQRESSGSRGVETGRTPRFSQDDGQWLLDELVPQDAQRDKLKEREERKSSLEAVTRKRKEKGAIPIYLIGGTDEAFPLREKLALSSTYFRFTREVLLHHIEQGDAARFMEMILTNAYSHQFKLKTITEQEIGFDRLRQAALQRIGSELIPWYFSYRVRIGIK
jgi:hypothetical protein